TLGPSKPKHLFWRHAVLSADRTDGMEELRRAPEARGCEFIRRRRIERASHFGRVRRRARAGERVAGDDVARSLRSLSQGRTRASPLRGEGRGIPGEHLGRFSRERGVYLT